MSTEAMFRYILCKKLIAFRWLLSIPLIYFFLITPSGGTVFFPAPVVRFGIMVYHKSKHINTRQYEHTRQGTAAPNEPERMCHCFPELWKHFHKTATEAGCNKD